MLGFTRQNNRPLSSIIEEPILKPMTIERHTSNKIIYPTKKHKIIHPINQPIRKKSTAQITPARQPQKEWVEGGHIDVFDNKLQKRVLDREEHSIRRLEKKKQLPPKPQSREKDQSAQKHGQIQRLKKMIEEEKKEQQKKDKQFEQKVKQIEQQRKQLQQLQKKLMQKGPPAIKQIKKSIMKNKSRQIPVSDRGRCHQQIRDMPLNSEQKASVPIQLQYLMKQREKALRPQPILNYTPTLIPLLSKASYKLISLNVSTLVELFIDELLEKEVLLLQALEEEKQFQKQKQYEGQVLNDYCQQLEDFVSDVQIIESRVGRYGSLDLGYHPKVEQNIQYGKKTLQVKWTEISVNGDMIQELQRGKQQFLRVIQYEDAYKKSTTAMLDELVNQLVNESVERLTAELQRGSEDFVKAVFQKQLLG